MEEHMKAHLTKLSLALLSTVFLLGCQDMGSGPVGPDELVPQFGKGGGKGKPGGDGDVTPMQATFTLGDLNTPISPTFLNIDPIGFEKNLLVPYESFRIYLIPADQDGSNVQMLKATFTVRLDKKTGQIATVKLWLANTENFRQATVLWHTDNVAVKNEVFPNAAGFTVEVDLDNVPLHAKGDRGDPVSRGSISIGHLVYTPVT